MNDLEFKKLWSNSVEKLETNELVIKNHTQEISQLKIHYFLLSMKPMKLFIILIGALWVGAGTYIISNMYIHAFDQVSLIFILSAAIQISLTAISLIIYLYQLFSIFEVDLSGPILKTQQHIANLKRSTLWIARILFLQLPVWTTFWWNDVMFEEWNLLQWSIPVAITLFFTFIAVWLFVNIRYENRNEKWFQLIFNGIEWTPLIKSAELLEQIEEFKRD